MIRIRFDHSKNMWFSPEMQMFSLPPPPMAALLGNLNWVPFLPRFFFFIMIGVLAIVVVPNLVIFFMLTYHPINIVIPVVFIAVQLLVYFCRKRMFMDNVYRVVSAFARECSMYYSIRLVEFHVGVCNTKGEIELTDPSPDFDPNTVLPPGVTISPLSGARIGPMFVFNPTQMMNLQGQLAAANMMPMGMGMGMGMGVGMGMGRGINPGMMPVGNMGTYVPFPNRNFNVLQNPNMYQNQNMFPNQAMFPNQNQNMFQNQAQNQPQNQNNNFSIPTYNIGAVPSSATKTKESAKAPSYNGADVGRDNEASTTQVYQEPPNVPYEFQQFSNYSENQSMPQQTNLVSRVKSELKKYDLSERKKDDFKTKDPELTELRSEERRSKEKDHRRKSRERRDDTDEER